MNRNKKEINERSDYVAKPCTLYCLLFIGFISKSKSMYTHLFSRLLNPLSPQILKAPIPPHARAPHQPWLSADVSFKPHRAVSCSDGIKPDRTLLYLLGRNPRGAAVAAWLLTHLFITLRAHIP